MTLFSITVLFFLLMDPLGNLGACQSMMQWVTPQRQTKVILREMAIALLVMVVVAAIGDGLVDLLKISETTVYFASGLIGFLFAINILFPSLRHPRANLPKEEPFIIPFAIPLIAGPSLLAMIILAAHSETIGFEKTMIALVIAWLASLIIMLGYKQLGRLLGQNGVGACERLMAMILVMISIQRFLEGTKLFITKVSAAG